MAILEITCPPTPKQIKLLAEELDNYIKLVADVEKEILYGGSRLHADIEQILLQQGSLQDHIWGGGVNLNTKRIDCFAIANYRSNNPSPDILDQNYRYKFINLVKKYFPKFIYG